MPKSKSGNSAFLQKDHRLRYLTWEGSFREDERLEIVKSGVFVSRSWILGEILAQKIQLTYDSFKNFPLSGSNMWKKSDFKLAIDEIKLYEMLEEKPATEKPVSAEAEALPPEQKTENKPLVDTLERQETPESDLKVENNEMPQASLGPSEVTNRISPPESFAKDFTPIKELILEENGKAGSEYNPSA